MGKSSTLISCIKRNFRFAKFTKEQLDIPHSLGIYKIFSEKTNLEKNEQDLDQMQNKLNNFGLFALKVSDNNKNKHDKSYLLVKEVPFDQVLNNISTFQK